MLAQSVSPQPHAEVQDAFDVAVLDCHDAAGGLFALLPAEGEDAPFHFTTSLAVSYVLTAVKIVKIQNSKILD